MWRLSTVSPLRDRFEYCQRSISLLVSLNFAFDPFQTFCRLRCIVFNLCNLYDYIILNLRSKTILSVAENINDCPR